VISLSKYKTERLIASGADENMISVPIRIFPSMNKKIDKVLKYDKEEIFESKSHFIRSAVNYFIKNSPTVNIIMEGKKW
jgi:hypothetical protein